MEQGMRPSFQNLGRAAAVAVSVLIAIFGHQLVTFGAGGGDSKKKVTKKLPAKKVSEGRASARRPPAATAVLGVPRIDGECEPTAVVEGLERNSDALEACYRTQLLEQSDLQGTVTLDFAVESDGTVSDPSVAESSIDTSGFRSCLLEDLADLRIATDSNSCRVRIPVHLSAGDEAPGPTDPPARKKRKKQTPDETSASSESQEPEVRAAMTVASVDAGSECQDAALRRALEEKKNTIRYCYERQLAADDELSGSLSLRAKTAEDCSFESVEITRSTIENRKTEMCVRRAWIRSRLDSCGSGCELRGTLEFSRSQPKD